MRSLPFTVRPQNLLEIRDACPTYLENDLRGKIRISYVLNPSTVRETGTFSQYVLDTNGNMVA